MEKQNLYIFSFSKFILKLLITLTLLGVAINYSFEKTIIFGSDINGASKVNRIINNTNINEIPIFGSSRAQGNFVPSIINSNCFNYGIDGTQANIWLFFLEEELKKPKQTPIIINFDLGGLNYADGNIGNYIPNWTKVKSHLKSEGEIYYRIPFIKYFGQYERYFKFYINEKINLTKVTDNGGSFEKNKLTQSKFQELVNKRKNTISKFSIEPKLETKFIRLIRSTNREIIFVISPYHISFFNKFENIQDANNYLQYLSSYKNVGIIDLRNYIKDDNLFINTTHLNYKGAVEFSKRLKELLTTLHISHWANGS